MVKSKQFTYCFWNSLCFPLHHIVFVDVHCWIFLFPFGHVKTSMDYSYVKLKLCSVLCFCKTNWKLEERYFVIQLRERFRVKKKKLQNTDFHIKAIVFRCNIYMHIAHASISLLPRRYDTQWKGKENFPWQKVF